MRALVYGGGAVGLGLASCLLKSQVSVDIIARRSTVSALRSDGLFRTGIFGHFHACPSTFDSYSSLTELPPGTYAYVLVCTKSFDSLNAARDLSEHKFLFADEAKIVLFQNGWGNADIFLQFFESERIYNARVITGFQRHRPNEVDVTVHADAIHVGSLFGADGAAVNDLAGTISEGGIPCQVTRDIGKDIWAKMLYNCALNPLGAILDVPYGTLAEYEFTRVIMDRIIEETFDVMRRAGYETHWQGAGDFLDVFYGKLVPDTAEHKSSTLQDITAGKRSEIDALNGAVIKLAKGLEISTPYNCVAYNLVKFKQDTNSLHAAEANGPND